MTKSVSIILPCYKAQDTLATILSDVLLQTYPEWELICISNKDGQEEQLHILKERKEKDNNIKFFTTRAPFFSLWLNLHMKGPRVSAARPTPPIEVRHGILSARNSLRRKDLLGERVMLYEILEHHPYWWAAWRYDESAAFRREMQSRLLA